MDIGISRIYGVELGKDFSQSHINHDAYMSQSIGGMMPHKNNIRISNFSGIDMRN